MDKQTQAATCNGCGGAIGRDCYNPQECEEISRQMAQSEGGYAAGYNAGLQAKDAEIAELRGLLVEAVDMLNHADRRFPPIHHAAYPYFRQTLAKITTALAGKEQPK